MLFIKDKRILGRKVLLSLYDDKSVYRTAEGLYVRFVLVRPGDLRTAKLVFP
jgi:hypothetical protein